MDSNKDGNITVDDVRYLDAFGNGTADAFIARCEFGIQDKACSYDDFVDDVKTRKNVIDSFNFLDRNNDGQINKEDAPEAYVGKAMSATKKMWIWIGVGVLILVAAILGFC